MKLTVGTKLGPYEIVAPLGSGGMGEVFQARDPRLNRFIAIKVLPAGAAEDPDRRARLGRLRVRRRRRPAWTRERATARDLRGLPWGSLQGAGSAPERNYNA